MEDIPAIASHDNRLLCGVPDCGSWRRWRPLVVVLFFIAIVISVYHVVIDLAAGGLLQSCPLCNHGQLV